MAGNAGPVPASPDGISGYNVVKRWPNLIHIDLLKSALCQASEQDLRLRVQELQERYVRLNCTIRAGKQVRDELTRKYADQQLLIDDLEEKTKHVDTTCTEMKYKVEENKKMACQYDCEVNLLQNQPRPKLPPKVTEDLAIKADLEKLTDQMFEVYGALLTLRAGEVVLFEDMKRMLDKQSAITRHIKNNVKEARRKLRDYEQSVFDFGAEQKKWKSTLKAGKLNICRRARHQHNGLKEEAAKLKRTIELFNEEKSRLIQAAKDFECALGTSLGEADLAELMEHFEPFLQVSRLYGPSVEPAALQFAGDHGGIRSMFKRPHMGIGNLSGGRKATTPLSLPELQDADRVSLLQKMYLDSIATKVKMEGNLLRTEFDINLLETSLTAESYYDNKRSDQDNQKMVRGMVCGMTSEELLGHKDDELAEYFDPEVKFPGKIKCN
ncbi:hypothetical protein RvY_12011 [Ramazzottius varieornatus]|uniref:Uncharacterized protein n=1 Tax=Ramazzottius varieornatus TaxID=947166 RepID=A0A1D1VQQ6_RAMVA|nr:hypothetical protein RvY_12011 [Ramazzottius varieornatus]